jgi:phage-related protein
MSGADEDGPRKIPLVFYRTPVGTEPVLDWLKSLPADERKEIGRDLMRAQWRWPVGMPLCRSLGGGLWEVRSNLPGRIGRVLFCIKGGNIVALHGFIKKTQKTPAADLKLARKRMKEVMA